MRAPRGPGIAPCSPCRHHTAKQARAARIMGIHSPLPRRRGTTPAQPGRASVGGVNPVLRGDVPDQSRCTRGRARAAEVGAAHPSLEALLHIAHLRTTAEAGAPRAGDLCAPHLPTALRGNPVLLIPAAAGIPEQDLFQPEGVRHRGTPAAGAEADSKSAFFSHLDLESSFDLHLFLS